MAGSLPFILLKCCDDVHIVRTIIKANKYVYKCCAVRFQSGLGGLQQCGLLPKLAWLTGLSRLHGTLLCARGVL